MSRQGFRVMTYNLRAFRDDWRAAAHAVRMVGPDVLCLQEVSRTWFPTRRTRAFAAAAGLDWPANRARGGGTTVLVRPGLVVTGWSHHRLRVPFVQGLREGVRGYAVVRLDLDLAGRRLPISMVSVHLGLRPQERFGQVERLSPGVPLDDPVVIAGDINEDDAGERGGSWPRRAGLGWCPRSEQPSPLRLHRSAWTQSSPRLRWSAHRSPSSRSCRRTCSPGPAITARSGWTSPSRTRPDCRHHHGRSPRAERAGATTRGRTHRQRPTPRG